MTHKNLEGVKHTPVRMRCFCLVEVEADTTANVLTIFFAEALQEASGHLRSHWRLLRNSGFNQEDFGNGDCRIAEEAILRSHWHAVIKHHPDVFCNVTSRREVPTVPSTVWIAIESTTDGRAAAWYHKADRTSVVGLRHSDCKYWLVIFEDTI